VRSFLIDNQLPAALGRWIETQGCHAQHVLALDLAQSPDETIWARAAATGAMIVSKDDDFAQLTLMRPEPVAVVWIRVGNCRTAELLRKMQQVWPDVIRELDSGARLVEVY
jgi:predicted nuclease of predicted toxin-antitoxin system